MVNEVNSLIFNRLVEGGDILIPDIGTLRVVRTDARKIRGRRVEAPSYSIIYDNSFDGLSLVDIIIVSTGVDRFEAEDIVRRWLDKSTIEKTLKIEGVGSLCSSQFTIDDELYQVLNPSDRVVVITHKRSKTPLIAAIVSLVVIITAALVYIFDPFSLRGAFNNYVENQPVADANISTDFVDVTDDAANSCERIAEVADSDNGSASVDVDNTQTSASSLESPSSTSIEHADENVPHDWREHRVRHYIIFGSYSTVQNANVAISNIMRKNPSAQCMILKHGRLHAVAVFGSDNIDECKAFKRENRALYKGAWIHTPKNLR